MLLRRALSLITFIVIMVWCWLGSVVEAVWKVLVAVGTFLLHSLNAEEIVSWHFVASGVVLVVVVTRSHNCNWCVGDCDVELTSRTSDSSATGDDGDDDWQQRRRLKNSRTTLPFFYAHSMSQITMHPVFVHSS